MYTLVFDSILSMQPDFHLIVLTMIKNKCDRDYSIHRHTITYTFIYGDNITLER
jgi:hypothetical protein